MTLNTVAQVGIMGLAGALGAMFRYLFSRYVAERTGAQFPLGTLLINLSGSFVIGLIAGLVGQKLLSPVLQLFLATGFLGGYTTFSTMSWEGVQLARSGSIRVSFFYLGGSLVLGLLAALLGLLVGGWL
jgi:fluoride exporter